MTAQEGQIRGFFSSSVNACGGPGTKVQVDTLGPGMPFTDDGPKGPKPRVYLIIRERHTPCGTQAYAQRQTTLGQNVKLCDSCEFAVKTRASAAINQPIFAHKPIIEFR